MIALDIGVLDSVGVSAVETLKEVQRAPEVGRRLQGVMNLGHCYFCCHVFLADVIIDCSFVIFSLVIVILFHLHHVIHLKLDLLIRTSSFWRGGGLLEIGFVRC